MWAGCNSVGSVCVCGGGGGGGEEVRFNECVPSLDESPWFSQEILVDLVRGHHEFSVYLFSPKLKAKEATLLVS
jgi:hypothetical protein